MSLTRLVAVAPFVLLVGVSDGASAQTVSLPAAITLKMEKPDPSVRPELAAYAAKWGGHWVGFADSNLIVESVTKEGDVIAVYVFGATPTVAAGGSRVRAKIVAAQFLIWGDSVNGTGFEFTMLPDGGLMGESRTKGVRDGLVFMTRIQ